MAGHLDADGNTSRTEGAEDDKERAVLDTHSVNLSVLLLEHATKNTPRVRISPFPFPLSFGFASRATLVRHAMGVVSAADSACTARGACCQPAGAGR